VTEEVGLRPKWLVDKRSKRGMKIVGRGNWLSADPVSLVTMGGALDDEAGVVALVQTGNLLAEHFCACEVSAAVSEEPARLFHVARGTIVYAVFFYPLFDIGLEKALAAVEVATKETCNARAMPKRNKKSQSDRIDWLCDSGWIDTSACRAMHSARLLRNHAIHDRQSLVGPGSVSRGFHRVRDLLEMLAVVRDSETPNHWGNVPHHHRAT
jgi:hypothetical protein